MLLNIVQCTRLLMSVPLKISIKKLSLCPQCIRWQIIPQDPYFRMHCTSVENTIEQL